MYTFNSDDTFNYSSRYGAATVRYRGTYDIDGNKILLNLNFDSVRTDGNDPVDFGVATFDIRNFLDSDDSYIVIRYKFNLTGEKLTITPERYGGRATFAKK